MCGSFVSTSFVHWQAATCYGNIYVCVCVCVSEYCMCPCACVCVNVLSFQSYAAFIRFIQLRFYFHVNRRFFVKLSCDYFAVLSFIVSLCFIYTYFLCIILYAYTYLDCVWCCFFNGFRDTKPFFFHSFCSESRFRYRDNHSQKEKVRENWERARAGVRTRTSR